MKLDPDSLILASDLEGLSDHHLDGYVTHALCLDGRCDFRYGGETLSIGKGDLMILLFNAMMTGMKPSSDFKVRVIHVSLSFMERCTPHTSYGVVGGLSMFKNPVMHLTERDFRLCRQDFDNVFSRMTDPHTHFHGDEMMAAVQMMFVDFYEFHARIYGAPDISALTAGIMRKFIDLLEQGEYRKSREVSHYADILCITPKYLSEVCRKVSGFSAGDWIDRFATIEITRLLKDKSLTFIDISDMFGFSSQSHFTRYVQKNLGASPTAFRM